MGVGGRGGGRGDFAEERHHDGGDAKAEGDGEEGVGVGLDLGFAEGEGPEFLEGGSVAVEGVAAPDGGVAGADALEEFLHGGVAGGEMAGEPMEMEVGAVVEDGAATGRCRWRRRGCA